MSAYVKAVLTKSYTSGLLTTKFLYQDFGKSLILSLIVDALAHFLIVSLIVPRLKFNANLKAFI